MKLRKNDARSEEQRHYESLTSYLKYAITITGTLLGIIFSIGIYFTYSSITDMKNDSKQTVKESQESIKEIVGTAKSTLENTKDNADKAINYIKTDAQSLAISASREKVEQAFKENNIKGVIEDVAHTVIEQKVQAMVDYRIKLLNENFAKNQNQMAVFILAHEKIRFVQREGLNTLDSIYRNSKDTISKRLAYQLMIEKGRDYVRDIPVIKDYYTRYKIAKDTSVTGTKSLVLKLKSDILNLSTDLYDVAYKTQWLSVLLNRKLDVFDLDAIRSIK